MAKIQWEILREIVTRHGTESVERVDADPVVDPVAEFMKTTRGELADLPELDADDASRHDDFGAKLVARKGVLSRDVYFRHLH